MVGFINNHRKKFGVEPICEVLPIAPSLYYERKVRERDPERRPARARRDVWRENRESVIGLFKTEEIRRRGPWKGLEDVEFATLECVAWYNVHRLLEPLGYVPPAEFEEAYYGRQTAPAELATLT